MTSKTTSNTNRYHHGNLRTACIDAGLGFLSKGKDDFSLRDIAREVGVSHGAPSRHFGTKEGLFAAIAEEGFHKFSKYLKQSWNEEHPKITFEQMLRAYVRFGMNHPQHYRLMFGNSVHEHSDYPSLNQAAKEAFGQLIEMVTWLQQENLFAPDNTLFKAYHIWSSIHGLVSLCIEGHIKIAVDVQLAPSESFQDLESMALQLVDDLSASLFRGLAR